ncbi:MAG: BrnT family toxin [Lachnospiraceae bacterium]|nr:BrnT family toxin [Lachnospiraceae bacterium]
MYNINIEIKFEWDEKKNRKNIIKHGISFEEAVTVFYDDDAIVFDDPEHSIDENRFLIVGVSENSKLCIVSHCYRDDEVIRIISARTAVKKEKEYYNNQFMRGDKA